MDIEKKIQEIRRKPERERLMYVYSAVGISMLIILIIWIISLRINLSGDTESSTSVRALTESINKRLDEEEQVKSIDELKTDGQTVVEQSKQQRENLQNEDGRRALDSIFDAQTGEDPQPHDANEQEQVYDAPETNADVQPSENTTAQ